MAHFALLNDKDEVTSVIVIDNSIILDGEGIESESVGRAYICSTLGMSTPDKVFQTSYNSNFRKHYAGIGMVYDRHRDAFMAKQPYPSWTLNEEEMTWEPPIPPPESDDPHSWDESGQRWIPVGESNNGDTLFNL